jgi:hypothetical protein
MNKFHPDIKLISTNLVIIGGVTRSGKSFLCPIISSFENFEMFFMSSIAENISYIDKLKKINSSYSSFVLKLIFNETIYNLNIGRNLNQRKSDYTSILNFRTPKMYQDRMKGKEGDYIIKRVAKEKKYYPVMFHDPLINPEIILNSFPNSKIIFVDRHPVDLIEEWMKKKYSSSFYENPRNATLAIKYKNKNFPHWCHKKLDKIYKAKNNYIRTVYSLSELIFQQKINLMNLKKKLKKRILLIKFDQLVQNTDIEIKKVTKFLNCKNSKFTKKTILQQSGNRKLNLNIRERKKKIIIKLLDRETVKLLKKLEKSYNEKKY